MKRSRLFAKESILLRKLQEMRKLAWEHKLGFNCLKGNYQAKCCLSEKRCLKEHCGLPHYTLLHESHQADSSPNKWTNTQSGLSGTSVPPQESVRRSKLFPSPLPIAKVNVNQVCAQPRRKVLLQVLPVQIHSQGWLVTADAVLDPGSDSTLIRKDWADHLQLVGESYQLGLSLNTVGSDGKTQHLNRVSFGLSSEDHPEPVIVNGAWVIDKPNIPSVKVPKKAAVDQWSHLSGINLPERFRSNASYWIWCGSPPDSNWSPPGTSGRAHRHQNPPRMDRLW